MSNRARLFSSADDVRRGRLSAAFGIGMLLLGATGTAADPGDAPDELLAYERGIDASRAMCHVILVRLRGIEAAALVELGPLVDRFERKTLELRSLGEAVDKTLVSAEGGGANVADWRSRREKAGADLERRSGFVRRFHGEAIRRVGPLPARTTLRSPQPEMGLRVRGTLVGGAGGSSYKRPNVTGTAGRPSDESSQRFEGRLEASTQLRSGTDLTAHLKSERRVERREIGLSDLQLGATHVFQNGVRANAEIGREGYSDEFNERLGYGEVRFRAGAELNRPGRRASVHLQRRSRSHKTDSDFADPQRLDYGVTTIGVDGSMDLTRGRLRGSLSRASRSAKNNVTDQNLTRLNGAWLLRKNGPEVRADLESLARPDNDTFDTQRLKGRVALPLSGQRTLTPEVLLYRFPNLDDAGYTDFGLELRRRIDTSDARGTKTSRATYRAHQSDEAFNFILVTHRSSSRPPSGAGRSTRLGSVLKLFTEGRDVDSLGQAASGATAAEVFLALGELTQALQTTREPHRLDLSAELLWTRPLKDSPIRRLEYGPRAGHILYADTERKDLQDSANDVVALLPAGQEVTDPLGDQDYLLRNPINRASLGASVAASASLPSGLTGRAQLGYDLQVLYNSDPVETFTALTFDVEARYPIRPAVEIEGALRTHRARFADDSPNDFDRFDLRLAVRYRFDVQTANLGKRRGEK